MRLMSSIAVLALSLMEDAARFFVPDHGRERYHRRSIPRDLPERRQPRDYDRVLAAKYQAERRARKAHEWERQQKWRACVQPYRRGGAIPAVYVRELALRFPAA